MAELGDLLKEQLRAWTFSLAGEGSRGRLEKLTPPRNEYGVDPYGMDVDFAVAAAAPFVWLYRKYFRVQLHGLGVRCSSISHPKIHISPAPRSRGKRVTF